MGEVWSCLITSVLWEGFVNVQGGGKRKNNVCMLGREVMKCDEYEGSGERTLLCLVVDEDEEG